MGVGVQFCWSSSATMRLTSVLLTLLNFAVVTLVIACGDVYGNAQPASEVGVKLAKPLVVRVLDDRGQNLYGVAVTWRTSTGTLADSSSLTDINGVAKMEWTLGPIAGSQTATATVTGVKQATFTEIAIAGPFAQIILTRDSVHLLGIGDVFQLRARAADRFGNFVPVRTTVESADTSIVTADNFGSGTGALLTARASNKTTTIRATAESIVKIGTVIVLPPPCQAGTNGFNLAVGEVALLSGTAASESEKTYMASVSVTAPDSWGFLKGSAWYAGIINGLASNSKDTTTGYVGGSLNTPVEGLSVGGAFDYRWDGPNTVTVGQNWAFAVAGYASFQANEKWKFNVRGDYTEGSDGTFYNRVGSNQNRLGALTLTADYALWANVISRAEMRWDHSMSGDKPYGEPTGASVGNRRNAVTAALNLIYKF